MESRDVYGRNITLNYLKHESFKTKIGGIVTLFSYALILTNLVAISTEFLNSSRQVEGTQTIKVDLYDDDAYTLSEYSLRFILSSSSPIPPSIGRWKVEKALTGKDPINTLK